MLIARSLQYRRRYRRRGWNDIRFRDDKIPFDSPSGCSLESLFFVSRAISNPFCPDSKLLSRVLRTGISKLHKCNWKARSDHCNENNRARIR